MLLTDIISHYLYGLRFIATAVMIWLVLFGFDDLFIDLYYWIRKLVRRFTIYKNRETFDEKQIINVKENPIAIMVPAWQEASVINSMLTLMASEMDYENYFIFVGTYPNDLETQKEVDAVSKHFPNIRKVTCARPGPTTKADCLNNVIAAILSFENQNNIKFSGFVLHDAEDVVSSMELRLFNYLLEKNDLVQIPVYPLSTSLLKLTSCHYIDELSETHGKEMVVRESLIGQVPSAGVGTCFSRRAILKLLENGDGLAFDIQSLTEDYDISFRIREWGMKEIFVHFSVTDSKYVKFDERSKTKSNKQGNVVCVREYFPETLKASVRQKSRWIIGIVYQGTKKLRWSKDWKMNYFLWRDRKGIISHFVSFLATIILLHILVLIIYYSIYPEGYKFLSIFLDDKISVFLIQLNLLFLMNRIVQRAVFVWQYYGVMHATFGPIRLLWSNLVNFLATVRAIKQIILTQRSGGQFAWTKTDHIYPSISERPEFQSLGQILVENNKVSRVQVEQALEQRFVFEKLGQTLLRLELINSDELGKALAKQANTSYERVKPFDIPVQTIEQLDSIQALKYRVLPLRKMENTLILASENSISPVALSILSRRLNCEIDYVLCQTGAVTLGLRYHYLNIDCDPRTALQEAVEQNLIDSFESERILDYFCSLQIQFGEAIQRAGFIEPTVFNQIMYEFDFSKDTKLGDFLIQRSIITEEVVDDILFQQVKRQLSIDKVISDFISKRDQQ